MFAVNWFCGIVVVRYCGIVVYCGGGGFCLRLRRAYSVVAVCSDGKLAVYGRLAVCGRRVVCSRLVVCGR